MEKLRILPEQTPANQLSQKDCPIMINCPEHGFYPQFVEVAGRQFKQSCPGCREKDQQIRKELAEEQQHRQAVEFNRQKMNIPKRHAGKSFDNIDCEYQKNKIHNLEMTRAIKVVRGFLNTWPERREKGASGFFCGNCGTGKTMLACMMVEYVASIGDSARYTTAWDMIQQIRLSYKTGESTREFVRGFIKPSLLVIDEIGVQSGSQDERVLMYQVIDGRYNEVKPTVLISNSKNPVEDGFLDMRTIDRLNEGGGFSITFNGESYRK